MESRARRMWDLARRFAVIGSAVALLDAAASTALAQSAAPTKAAPAATKAAPPAATRAVAPAPTKGAPAARRKATFDATTCLDCHQPIKAFYETGKHKNVGCNVCHDKLTEHSANRRVRPTTNMDSAVCGSCHKLQFESQFRMNYKSTARKEKSLQTGLSPNPSWEKLMTPHPFTREHNKGRAHAFTVLDQFLVDRAFGGRFQPKEGWQYLTKQGNFKVWDVIEDRFPDNTDQKVFVPGTAAAANPMCWTCKSADLILDWAYMGDPVPGATWSRTSRVVELVKHVNHARNCIFCHDPHSAGPRIIRDALIQAITRPEKDTLFHADKRAPKVEVHELGVRGFTRKIATLSRHDTKLQCGQCHVEYIGNPGLNLDGTPFTTADRRSNTFPYKDVQGTLDFYTALNFRDFRHGITGALLIKNQHPDVENYYGSAHQRAGVECHQCHMPKMKDPKTGRTYTSHFSVSPRQYLRETCLTCHSGWSEKQAEYVIESLHNRVQGKTRKAEFWLVRLIDKFEEARNLGVAEPVLNQVRERHTLAHMHWEWWTASNGHAFHNPDKAIGSLNRSMIVSQEGIKILDDAMAERRKVLFAPAAAAAPAPAAPAK